MDREELFKKIADIQDTLIGLYTEVKNPDYYGDILEAMAVLLDIRLAIEGDYRYILNES